MLFFHSMSHLEAIADPISSRGQKKKKVAGDSDAGVENRKSSRKLRKMIGKDVSILKHKRTLGLHVTNLTRVLYIAHY